MCPELTAIEGTGEDCACAKKATMMIKQSEIDKKYNPSEQAIVIELYDIMQ